MIHCRDNVFHDYEIIDETSEKIRYCCKRCKNKLVVDKRDTETISKTQIRDLLQPSNPMFWFEYGKIDRLHSDHLLKVLPRSGWSMPEMKLKDLLKFEDYNR